MDTYVDKQEGLIDTQPLFDLDLPDQELVNVFNKRITEAEKHWNGTDWKLDTVYDDNRNMWLPNHLKGQELYKHEVPYQDPRTFVATETIVSQANARVANPEVSPSTDSDASAQLAKDLNGVLVEWCRIHNMKQVQRQVTRGVLIERHAYAYLYWDDEYGDAGDICVEYVSGKDILPDPKAKLGEQPRYFIRKREKTLQEILLLFPDKKAEILKSLKVRGVATQMGDTYGYRECWFTYYEDEEPYIGVVFKLNDIILGKMKNPNWKENGKNFLPRDVIPYIPLNYLNLGDSYIDHTTLIEQAKSAQMLLDKRGKQAAEITDQAMGGLVFNSQMISKKEGMKLTGHPKEKVFVDGDVRQAVVRMDVQDVSPGVIQDKEDARASIDNTFGTHAPTRGEQSGNATLGQDVLQSQKDLTRNDELIRSIDQFFHNFFNLLVQMMMVYYDSEHMFQAVGEDGKFDFVAMSSKHIEHGCRVFVEPGSTLPIDKNAMRETGLALAKMQLTDPLSLFEDLGLPNPNKRFTRLVTWLTNPQKMVQDADDEDFDRKAFMDIQVLISGNKLDEREDINDRYVKYFTNYIKSGAFARLDKKEQRAITDYLAKEVEVLQRKLKLEESTLPTPDQMAQGNAEAVNQASQQAAIMQGQPPAPDQDPAAAAMASAPTKATGQPQMTPPRGTSQQVANLPNVPNGDTPTA